ncbi:MAG: hypothetical protein GY821_13290 [Gammaproteobacteria bacterium]|nr:hypothetical protein [Gammaproteobacteria bacterium]
MPSSYRPFLRWVGGKSQLLPHLLKRFPLHLSDRSRYIEPFVGGGSLYFALQPKQAILADVNEELIRTYRYVRDAVGTVIMLLKLFQPHTSLVAIQIRKRVKISS